MNGVDAMRSAFEAAHFWFDGTVADVTEEQLSYKPQGKAHSIGELVVHVHQAEDWAIQQLGRGQPSLWESGGWEDRLGLPTMARLQDDFEGDLSGCLAKIRPYAEAVRSATDEYFDSLTDEDLDREVDLSALGMEPMPLGQVLTGIALGNTFAHTGEISTVKGLQGAQGYPF